MMDWRWWTTPAEPRFLYLVYFAIFMVLNVGLASPLWIGGGRLGTAVGIFLCMIPSHFCVKLYMERDIE